jgi:hypothetical protein
MHWVVDRSLGRRNALGQGGEAGYENLIDALERSQTPYTLVRKIPFSGTLIDPDDESRDPRVITLDLENPVFVCGTLSMLQTSTEHGWAPGYIDGVDVVELEQHWGNHMLNAEAVVGTFADLEPPSDDFFARPVDDSKSFSGTVFAYDADKPQEGNGREQWLRWREQVMDIQSSNASIRADDLVIMAPLKNIYAEYRLFVVGGQIVTGSRYKLGGRVFYTPDIDPAVRDFARERLAEYCPRRAMCLDIAHIEGDESYKVIETNSISSAGFYACDMNQFVGAINAEFGE